MEGKGGFYVLYKYFSENYSEIVKLHTEHFVFRPKKFSLFPDTTQTEEFSPAFGARHENDWDH